MLYTWNSIINQLYFNKNKQIKIQMTDDRISTQRYFKIIINLSHIFMNTEESMNILVYAAKVSTCMNILMRHVK